MRRQYNKAKGGGGGVEDMERTYFYVEDVSGADNTLQIKQSGSSAPTVVLEYSYDQDTWQDVGTISTTATNIIIPANGKVYLRGVNSAFGDTSNYNNIAATRDHNVGGNIMSLLYGEDFIGKYVCKNPYSCKGLFYNNKNLVDATNLRLPATTLALGCYQNMYYGCASLVAAPTELPATTLAPNCYQNMYYNCTSLVAAPKKLPAATLASSCYSYMYYSCTSLTTASEIYATSVSQYSCQYMYYNCTSLVAASKKLPATNLATGCYSNMYRDCTSLTIASELSATTLAPTCCQNMYFGCISLTIAPELPATTLIEQCYQNIFYGCKLINRIVALFTQAPSSTLCSNWVFGVAAKGVFVMSKEATWNPDDYRGATGVPNGWTIEYI